MSKKDKQTLPEKAKKKLKKKQPTNKQTNEQTRIVETQWLSPTARVT